MPNCGSVILSITIPSSSMDWRPPSLPATTLSRSDTFIWTLEGERGGGERRREGAEEGEKKRGSTGGEEERKRGRREEEREEERKERRREGGEEEREVRRREGDRGGKKRATMRSIPNITLYLCPKFTFVPSALTWSVVWLRQFWRQQTVAEVR